MELQACTTLPALPDAPLPLKARAVAPPAGAADGVGAAPPPPPPRCIHIKAYDATEVSPLPPPMTGPGEQRSPGGGARAETAGLPGCFCFAFHCGGERGCSSSALLLLKHGAARLWQCRAAHTNNAAPCCCHPTPRLPQQTARRRARQRNRRPR